MPTKFDPSIESPSMKSGYRLLDDETRGEERGRAREPGARVRFRRARRHPCRRRHSRRQRPRLPLSPRQQRHPITVVLDRPPDELARFVTPPHWLLERMGAPIYATEGDLADSALVIGGLTGYGLTDELRGPYEPSFAGSTGLTRRSSCWIFRQGRYDRSILDTVVRPNRTFPPALPKTKFFGRAGTVHSRMHQHPRCRMRAT